MSMSADFEEMVRDIAQRLRSVCGDLCEEEYLALVISIAQTKRRFLVRDHAEAILNASGLGRGADPGRRRDTMPHARQLSSLPPGSTSSSSAAPPP